MNIDKAFQDNPILRNTNRNNDLQDINRTDKSQYYLGAVSSVWKSNATVQIENMSVIQGRIYNDEPLYPNSINFLVIIDSKIGLFIGRITTNGIKDSESIHKLMKEKDFEHIYPEAKIDIFAINYKFSPNFVPSGFRNVGVHDKVYIAPQNIVQEYYKSLEILPNLEQEHNLTSFAELSFGQNSPICFKPSTLFSRHLMVLGTTGSGKSTSSLAIIDKLIEDNIKVLMIDPTGEYANSFDSDEIKHLKLGIDTGILPGSLTINQWIGLLNASPGIQAPALMKAIQALRFQKKNGADEVYVKKQKKVSDVESDIATLNEYDKMFDLELLAQQLIEEAVQENRYGKYEPNDFKLNAIRLLIERMNQVIQTTQLSSFFSGTNDYSLIDELNGFLNNDSNLLIDASELGASNNVGAMIIDLICRYLNNQKSSENSAFVIFIDEVHRYTQAQNNIDDNIYFEGLDTISREGRKKGIYLLLTSQSPMDVSKLLLGQMGTLLIHRLTQPDEIHAVKNFLDEQDLAQIKNLAQGEAILTSVNLLQDIHLNISKSHRKHQNESPSLQKNENTKK